MKSKIILAAGVIVAVPVLLFGQNVTMPIPKIAFDIAPASGPKDVALSLQILFLLSILTLAPSIIIMMTAFTRVVIVLDFVKRALSLQQMPPNQVIVGLSLFLTFFIMAPTFTEMNNKALQPYLTKGSMIQVTAEDLHIDRIRGDDFFELRALFHFISHSIQQIVFLEWFCIEQVLMHKMMVAVRTVLGQPHVFVQIDRCHPREIKLAFPHDPVQPDRRAACG